MSGMASTGTGSRGSDSISQSNGATITPQSTRTIVNSMTTSLFSRQKRMSLLMGFAETGEDRGSRGEVFMISWFLG